MYLYGAAVLKNLAIILYIIKIECIRTNDQSKSV